MSEKKGVVFNSPFDFNIKLSFFAYELLCNRKNTVSRMFKLKQILTALKPSARYNLMSCGGGMYTVYAPYISPVFL